MGLELFTIGYEGRAVEDFVVQLKNFAIDCLIDVREIPLSRKPGFSKSTLAQRLARENIKYVHLKDLGSPKSIREKLKKNWDYAGFFEKMETYLECKRQALEEAYVYVIENNCCLMCFEKLATKCHRKIVAKKIEELDGNGLRVKNI